jgi:hypothetical protein
MYLAQNVAADDNNNGDGEIFGTKLTKKQSTYII